MTRDFLVFLGGLALLVVLVVGYPAVRTRDFTVDLLVNDAGRPVPQGRVEVRYRAPTSGRSRTAWCELSAGACRARVLLPGRRGGRMRSPGLEDQQLDVSLGPVTSPRRLGAVRWKGPEGGRVTVVCDVGGGCRLFDQDPPPGWITLPWGRRSDG